MKNNKTVKLTALLLCLVLALSLAACSASDSKETTAAQEGEKDLLAQIQERGTLVIGTEGNWAPWTYHDKDDKLVGLDIEIGTLIAEGLGVKADFQETDWDAILAGVDSGRFDMACNGVGYTAERAEKYDFSTPYVYTPKVLVVRGDNTDITKLEDLDGKKTANSPGSTYADLGAQYGAEVTSANTLDQTIELLLQDRVDATINAKGSIDDYLAEHPDADIKIVQQLDGDPVAYPMPKGSESLVKAVNDILDELRENGKLAEISLKYFNEDMTKAQQ